MTGTSQKDRKEIRRKQSKLCIIVERTLQRGSQRKTFSQGNQIYRIMSLSSA